jgi:TnpA family transposase
MATHLKIFSEQDITVFEKPPEFTGEERKRYFDLPKWAIELVEKLQTPTNKVGFILQLGYFKAINRFFIIEKSHQKDMEFVVRKLQLSPEAIQWNNYPENTRIRHREMILENTGFQKFDEQTEKLLTKEALSLCSNQLKPRLIFLSLVDFLRSIKIEIPGYYTLSSIITTALRHFERKLVSLVENEITVKDKQLLDELLEISEKYLSPEKQDLKLKRYKITMLKKSNQSTKPSLIKENIDDLNSLQLLFKQLEPLIVRLGLSSGTIRYYALILIKSRIFQISQRRNNRYLLLVSFIIHQYYTLNDVLIDILIASAQTILNTSFREHKDLFYEARQTKQQAAINVSQNYRDTLNALKKIKETISGREFPPEEMLNMIYNMISEQESLYPQIEEQLDLLEKETTRIIKDDDYYDILESKSIKLQNRVSEIIKHVIFDKETSDSRFIRAIEYYKDRDGQINADAPIDFLELEEQRVLTDETGKFRISLYKALLFEKVADAIKSGALNLLYSYKYRAFDDYLIPQNTWSTQKKEFLERAGLTDFADYQKLESSLKQILQAQYRQTNENTSAGINKYARIDETGNLKVLTPRVEEHDTVDTILNLFPQNRFIPLFEVLSTISKTTGFLDCFEYWQTKYNRRKPAEKTFLAGIIGYGCNLGIRKIARISNDIKQNELENTVNWYFSEENLARANDAILYFIGQLQLPKLFNKSEDITHTSSDGQKFNIGVDSLNANYSYKYFGKGKGVSVYSFIDESHRLFYSTVISSSEREAAYVIDGLMHNDVVQSDIHSTDTHGYSEIIFGVTHLLGISYAPRIKNFKDQRLYSFDSQVYFKNLDYNIVPDGKINSWVISNNWDNILRLVATIKLKETTASQLFRRLSSYSRQNPLYHAIKEFGKIIKTIFLLKYIDDVQVRQDVEKQLNKLESSNKFAKAVFYGNNQEFQQETKEEQLIAEGCKRLIQNAIICWNYLYLSQELLNASEQNRQDLIKTIKNGSVVVWQHINLLGEYDFSEEILKNSINFQLPKLLDLKIE